MFVLPAMSWHLLGNSFMYATPEKRCDMDRITTCGYDKTGKILNEITGCSKNIQLTTNRMDLTSVKMINFIVICLLQTLVINQR